MNKQTFLKALSDRLLAVTPEKISPTVAANSLDYYGEIIDDRIEHGMSEEAAVAAIGHPDDIFRAILTSLVPLQWEPVPREPVYRTILPEPEKKKTSPWLIALLVITFPVWFSLLMAGAAVLIGLYAVLWSLVVSLWAVCVSLAVGGILSIGAAVPLILSASLTEGLAALGAGIAAVGLSLVFFVLSLAATRLAARLTSAPFRGIAALSARKERMA